MSILNQLVRSRGVRSDENNIALSKRIAAADDKNAVKELVENLSNKNKKIQADCIKTLYETAEIKAELVSEYYKECLEQLESKNHRMVWGATCVLSAIAFEKPKELYDAIPNLLEATERSKSVIAKDHTVEILCKLATFPEYNEDLFHLLLEIILKAPINQLAMYIEHTAEIVTEENKSIFLDTLICRLPDVEDFSAKQKRINKVIKLLPA